MTLKLEFEYANADLAASETVDVSTATMKINASVTESFEWDHRNVSVP